MIDPVEPDIIRDGSDDEFPLLVTGTAHRPPPSLRTGGGGVIGRAAITNRQDKKNFGLIFPMPIAKTATMTDRYCKPPPLLGQQEDCSDRSIMQAFLNLKTSQYNV